MPFRLLIPIYILAVTALITTGCSPTAPGTLEGTVSIGPIWPVERPGYNPPVSPQVFESRKIVVYDSSGLITIATVDIHQTGQTARGTYRVQLSPGTYLVRLGKNGIDHSKDLPRTLTITSGQNVVLDIDIDTGIR